MSEQKKATRVKQACNFCRSRKAKCDGLLPHCTACSANPENCIYSTLRKRRGLPSGYTHDLERKVLVFQALISYVIRDKSPSTNLLETLEKCLIDPIEAKNVAANMDSLQIFWDDNRLSSLVQNFIKTNCESIHMAKRSSRGLKNIIKAEDGGDVLENDNENENESERIGENGNRHEIAHINEQRSGGNGTLIPSMNAPFDPSYKSGIGNSTLGSNGVLPNATPSSGNLVGDPSFISRDELFHFMSENLDGTEQQLAETRDSWKPTALKFQGLSTLLSGFTPRAIQQYSNSINLQSKRPFRVGSIFNISSASISVTRESAIKIPEDILSFPNEITDILACYFQVYHPWCPMLNRVFIMKLSHRIQALKKNTKLYQQNHSSSFKASECNLVALIWAIITLGKLVNRLQNDAKSADATQILCETYAKNCIKALENSPTTSIETIQSMVILGIFYYQTGNWDRSWTLTSSATRMAVDVGLMHKTDEKDTSSSRESASSSTSWLSLLPTSRSDSTEEKDPKVSTSSEEDSQNNTNRERTWGCIYMLNTILSSRLGREPIIRACDWPVPHVNEDGWEEWESWTSYHSPQTIKLDSGRFLLIFNQLLQVIALWNLALTCIIDVSEDTLVDDQDNTEIYKIPKLTTKNWKSLKKSAAAPNTQTLAFFQSRLDDLLKSMPEYCKLETYPDFSKLPPFVSFLHLSRAMIWCILTVRLSALKKSITPTIKDEIILLRNLEYTKSVLLLKKIINRRTLINLKDYAFIDYFTLMAAAFPKMIDFKEGGETELRSHTKTIEKLLSHGATLSHPFKITLDVYNINKGFERDNLGNSNKRTADENSKTSAMKLLRLMSGGVLGGSAKESEEATSFSSSSSSKAKTSILSLLNYKHSNSSPAAPKSLSLSVSPGVSSSLRYPPPVHETARKGLNIDNFLLDMDLNKTVVRQKEFVEHMGYIPKGPDFPRGNTEGMAVYSNNVIDDHNISRERAFDMFDRNTMHQGHLPGGIKASERPAQSSIHPNVPPILSPSEVRLNGGSLNNAPVPSFSPYRTQDDLSELGIHFNNVFVPSNGLNAFLYHTLSKQQ